VAPERLRPLAAREFEAIRQLAHRSFGLDLQPGKEELVTSRLQRLVRSGGFRSYREYYHHVIEDSTGEALRTLIDALATNHTSFLREGEHFEFLRQTVVPMLLRRASIEAWSAACSTGEEVWSLAFLLNDAKPLSPIRLLGTDISRKALAVCNRGVYSADRVSVLPPAWVSTYLDADGRPPQAYSVKPRIREQAAFQRANLIDPWDCRAHFPIIFCRNVMIYFDRPTQERVLANVFSHLEPGGYLFIGHAESLTGMNHGLEYVRPAVYRRAAAKGNRWTG
jgi:chemotaxis protein methyltransferase CheR